jgi:hypothetical protein
MSLRYWTPTRHLRETRESSGREGDELMVGSVGKKGSGRTAKRPAPTIEGTATEVTVEPVAGEAKSEKDKASTKARTRRSAASADKAGSAKDHKPEKIVPPKPQPSETPEQVAATPAPRRRGVLSLFAAGLLGGLAGAGALALAWSYLPTNEPVSEPVEAPDLTPLEDRLAKLEAAPAALGESAELAKLDARLDDLEGREPRTSPQVSALAGRVSQLEAGLKSMAEAAKDGGSVADAAVISQQIGEAEKRLDAKIAAALTAVQSVDANSLEALQKEISRIGAKLRALTEAELTSGDSAHLAPEIAKLDERLAGLEAAIPRLVTVIEREAEDTRTATLAIAFANLRAAVAEGRPYIDELATLAALSPGAGGFGGLLDYDDKGIPTLTQLTRSFDLAKDAALAAPVTDADGSMLDRLMASAESLVKVRRIDAEAEGYGPSAVLARAAAQLKQGDLAAAVKEVATLKGAQEAAFANWLDEARARLGADATLQRLQNILLVSLSGNGADGEIEPEEKPQTGEQED